MHVLVIETLTNPEYQTRSRKGLGSRPRLATSDLRDGATRPAACRPFGYIAMSL